MTLAERNDLIERTMRNIELEFPAAHPATLIEMTCHAIARYEGLTVTPDEVTRTLAKAAGFVS